MTGQPIFFLFNVGPREIKTIPGLGARMRHCGIRHLRIGAYTNPADGNVSPQDWPAKFEKLVVEPAEWCRMKQWRYIAYGDDFMRFPYESAGMTEDSVKQALEYHAQNGFCDGIELVDEMSNDPSQYPRLAEFFKWAADIPNCPPIACPGFQPQVYERMGATAISRQWNHSDISRQKHRIELLKASLSDIPRDGRRVTALITVCRERYSKRVEGGEYTPGDVLWHRGPRAAGIREQIQVAWRKGALVFGLYGFDWIDWKNQRRDVPIGWRYRLQTGISLADDRWTHLEDAVREVHTQALAL